MRVLVVGATGFVGGAVARHLAAVGHDVTGVVRASTTLPADIVTVEGDLDHRLPAVVAEALRNDAVVLAAQAPVDVEYAEVSTLLDALAGTGKTMLCTSGSGVLMQRTWGAWSADSFAEDDPFTPEPLAARRVDTEHLVRAAPARGVRGIVLRPPMLWGPGDHGHLSQIYRSVGLTGAACYIGDGDNVYSELGWCPVHGDMSAEIGEPRLRALAAI